MWRASPVAASSLVSAQQREQNHELKWSAQSKQLVSRPLGLENASPRRRDMTEGIGRLLTPEVLIAAIAATAFTSAVFMYFISRTARTGINAAQSIGGQAVTAASDAIEQFAQSSADVLKPVGKG